MIAAPRGRRKEPPPPSLHCSSATLDTVTRARCTPEIMKDGERKNCKRNGNAGGSKRQGDEGDNEWRKKEIPIYHRVSKCVLCDFMSIFVVLLCTLKA